MGKVKGLGRSLEYSFRPRNYIREFRLKQLGLLPTDSFPGTARTYAFVRSDFPDFWEDPKSRSLKEGPISTL